MMHTLQVALAGRSYPIYIGDKLLGRAELLTRHMPQPRAALVTDSLVAPLYFDAVAGALTAAGVKVTPVIVPTGEQHHRLACVHAENQVRREPEADIGLARS